MILELIPESLHSLSSIKTLLFNKHSLIMHKTLDQSLIDKEMFISTAAVLFVVQGEQVIRNYSGKDMAVQQGALIYLPKDIYVVSDFVTSNDIFEAVIFFIEEEVIEQISLSLLQRVAFTAEKVGETMPVTLQSGSKIKAYIQALISVYRDTKNSPELANIKLSELFQLIKIQGNGSQFLSSVFTLSAHPKKRSIRSFMRDNYLKNLKVEDYALLTGRSLSSFTRDFKRLYGTTPHQWLINARLEKAYELLTTTEINVTETAFEVGYENVSHFIKAYKKKFGCTPNQQK